MTHEKRLKAIVAELRRSLDLSKPTPAVANRCDACGDDFTGIGTFCRPCCRLAAEALERASELRAALEMARPVVSDKAAGGRMLTSAERAQRVLYMIDKALAPATTPQQEE